MVFVEDEFQEECKNYLKKNKKQKTESMKSF